VLLLALAALELTLARWSVDKAQDKADPAGLAKGRPLGDLRRARTRFRRAHALVDNPVVLPLRALPVVGRQMRSVATLAAAAAHVSDVGIGAVTEAKGVLDLPHGGGPERVALLRRLQGLATATDGRLASIDLGPRLGLVSPLASARNQIARQLAELRDGLGRATAGANAAADLLQGPHRYLVVAANNAEMRAGSGMWLSLGELTTENGTLHLGAVQSQGFFPIPRGQVKVDDADLAARWGWAEPASEWRNLMLSPRFDVSAALASKMWVAAGQPAVDGVLVLDPVALEAVLEATGPVPVGDDKIGAKTVVDELTHNQYLDYALDRFPSAEELTARRDQSGAIARAAFDALDEGGWDPAALAAGITRAARGRHLLLWSKLPVEEQGWQAAQVDGGLADNSMLVSVLNRGGNKLDRFLNVSSQLELKRSKSGTEGTLRVTMRNLVDPKIEPLYVAGPYPGRDTAKGTYVGILTVNLPGAALEGRIDGRKNLNVVGGDGPSRVVGAEVEVPFRGEKTLVVRFRLPPGVGTLHVAPSARVPAVSWRFGKTKWADDVSKDLRW
jgi:hypothetical protein